VALGSACAQHIADGSTPLETATQCTYLGAYIRASADARANEIVVGYGAIGAGSNTATLGNTSITFTVLRGAVAAGSSLVTSGGFGCNTKTAQAAYASGGALAAYSTGAFGLDSDAHMSSLHAMVVSIRAALVANGIMS
jgi:hypothetical protein